MGTLHEFGHITYEHGIALEDYGTPIGRPRSLSLGESKSRFWENHVGRSWAFWEYYLPKRQQHFSDLADVTVDDVYESVNHVCLNNPIRVTADEISYHLHNLLRYEIEKAVMAEDEQTGAKDIDEMIGIVVADERSVGSDTTLFVLIRIGALDVTLGAIALPAATDDGVDEERQGDHVSHVAHHLHHLGHRPHTGIGHPG